MANRVTADEVKEILETSLTDAQTTAFITAANLTVTDVLSSSTVLSTDQLKEIERWLSAHLIASTRDQKAQAEKAGDVSITYQGKTGQNLDSTFYGQQVKMLDTSGVLVRSLFKKKATIYSVTSFD